MKGNKMGTGLLVLATCIFALWVYTELKPRTPKVVIESEEMKAAKAATTAAVAAAQMVQKLDVKLDEAAKRIESWQHTAATDISYDNERIDKLEQTVKTLDLMLSNLRKHPTTMHITMDPIDVNLHRFVKKVSSAKINAIGAAGVATKPAIEEHVIRAVKEKMKDF